MQSKSDMSDSQHMQYCLAQRSCPVSTSGASHPLNTHVLSVLTERSEFSQYMASCTSRKTPMATEIQGKPCRVCSSYEKLHSPCNNMTHPVLNRTFCTTRDPQHFLTFIFVTTPRRAYPGECRGQHQCMHMNLVDGRHCVIT